MALQLNGLAIFAELNFPAEAAAALGLPADYNHASMSETSAALAAETKIRARGSLLNASAEQRLPAAAYPAALFESPTASAAEPAAASTRALATHATDEAVSGDLSASRQAPAVSHCR